MGTGSVPHVMDPHHEKLVGLEPVQQLLGLACLRAPPRTQSTPTHGTPGPCGLSTGHQAWGLMLFA